MKIVENNSWKLVENNSSKLVENNSWKIVEKGIKFTSKKNLPLSQSVKQ